MDESTTVEHTFVRDDCPSAVLQAQYVGCTAFVQEGLIPAVSRKANDIGVHDDMLEESRDGIGELPIGNHTVAFRTGQNLVESSGAERPEVTHVVALGVVAGRHLRDPLHVPFDPGLPPPVDYLERLRTQIGRFTHTCVYSIRVPTISAD